MAGSRLKRRIPPRTCCQLSLLPPQDRSAYRLGAETWLQRRTWLCKCWQSCPLTRQNLILHNLNSSKFKVPSESLCEPLHVPLDPLDLQVRTCSKVIWAVGASQPPDRCPFQVIGLFTNLTGYTVAVASSILDTQYWVFDEDLTRQIWAECTLRKQPSQTLLRPR